MNIKKKKGKASHKVRNKSCQYKNKFTFTTNKYDVVKPSRCLIKPVDLLV